MAGYDGHKGWINYFAVHPDFHGQGYEQQMMENVKSELRRQVTSKSIC